MTDAGKLELSQAQLRGAFDERTFQRGLDYFESGHVVFAAAFHGSIWGEVAGREMEPYRVKVERDEGRMVSWCSCPVGFMCKHGAALALCWIDDPGSFVNAEGVVSALGDRTKEELVALVEGMLRSDPTLMPRIELALLRSDAGRGMVDTSAVGRWVDRAISGGLDHYSVAGVVRELDEILGIARDLRDASLDREAAVVCLLLVGGCVEAYRRGANDSSGDLGELAHETISLFNAAAEGIDDEAFKDMLLPGIFDIYSHDDRDLETGGLFTGVVTRANIEGIESELERRLEEEVRGREGTGGGHDEYRRMDGEELVKRLRRRVDSSTRDDGGC